ncbi:CREB-regulated transcription coactivator 1-like isoform X5 [Amblyomma americanum]
MRVPLAGAAKSHDARALRGASPVCGSRPFSGSRGRTTLPITDFANAERLSRTALAGVSDCADLLRLADAQEPSVQTSHGQDNMQAYATSYDSSYMQQAANGAYSKHQLSISPSLGAYRGGSLPNVNQMSGGPAHSIDLQGALNHLEDMRQGREASSMLPDRPHVRERGRHATAPHKGRQMAFDKRADVSPYSSALYLSPPPDTSWRRTNSDSALHQSAQTPQENFPGVGPSCGQRRDPVTARELDQMYRDCSGRVDGFGQEILGMDMNSMAMDSMNLKGYWDPKGGGGGDCYPSSLSSMGCGISTQHQHQQQQHRPKSCDVPGINIYLPQDESGDGGPLTANSPGATAVAPPPGAPGVPPGAGSLQAPPPMGNGNTGSLPDLTSLHFPPPLATPLDPSEELAHQQQAGGQGGPPSLPPLHPGNAGSPGSPRGCTSPSGGRHASPGPAPSPSSRRRVHHNSTSMVLGSGGRLHGSSASQQATVGAPGQVRAHSPLHHNRRHHRPHPPRITVEGLTMDTNALSLDGYGGGSQQAQQQQHQQQHQHQPQHQQQHQHQQQQQQHQQQQQQQQQQQLGYYPPQSPQCLGQSPGSPLAYPPSSPTLTQQAPSPRPRQLYQGGAPPSERSGSAPASPVSHGAPSPVSSPSAVGSPYGAGGYRTGSALGSTSPLQQQMEQFRVAAGSTDDSTSPSAAQTQSPYFVMPDGRYCSNPSIPTSVSSGGSVFFADMGPGSGMGGDALSCSLPYSHDSLYYTGDLQYSAKTAASPSSGAPQTPQTPTSIPDIILTGPGTDEAALLKGALQQAKVDGQSLGSFDSADLFSTEEALRADLGPIDIDGLQILTDPDMAVISDPAAEEAFRLDRS